MTEEEVLRFGKGVPHEADRARWFVEQAGLPGTSAAVPEGSGRPGHEGIDQMKGRS